MKKIVICVVALMFAFILTSCKDKRLTNSNFDSFEIVFTKYMDGKLSTYNVEKVGKDYLINCDTNVYPEFYHLKEDGTYELYVKENGDWRFDEIPSYIASEEDVFNECQVKIFFDISYLDKHDYKTDKVGDQDVRKYSYGDIDYVYSVKDNIFLSVTNPVSNWDYALIKFNTPISQFSDSPFIDEN